MLALFTERPFFLWLANSTLVALVVTATGVVLASTCGYAFSRYSFTGKKIGLLGLLVTQMFPATMLLLPMYIMLVMLHLINTYLGIVIMYSATALPFCIWQMKGYYDTIPRVWKKPGGSTGATSSRPSSGSYSRWPPPRS
jgi:arabinogalactan oligomer/maltooligosaccharide transport system permease protein